MVFFQDNWNNLCEFLHKSFVIKLDSGDEDSADEALKNSRKGKEKLTDSNISSKALDKGKNPELVANKEGESSGSGREIKYTREELVDLIVNASWAASEISADTKHYYENFIILGKGLEKLNTLDLKRLSINNPDDVKNVFIPLLQEQGTSNTRFLNSRSAWMISRAANLEPENKTKVLEVKAKMEVARKKYLDVIGELDKYKDTTTQVKVYFAALNEQRNSVFKEFNKADDIIIKDLKASPFCRIDHDDCKNLVTTLKEYSNAKREFITQDSILKSKISEVINRKI